MLPVILLLQYLSIVPIIKIIIKITVKCKNDRKFNMRKEGIKTNKKVSTIKTLPPARGYDRRPANGAGLAIVNPLLNTPGMKYMMTALQLKQLPLLHFELIQADGAVDALELTAVGDVDDVLLELLHQLSLVVLYQAASDQQENAQHH